MASHNGELFIAEQILSILKQLDVKDELLISDDGSIDKTVEIIDSFNDRRVKVFKNMVVADHIKNFNFVLSQARGDFIFLSDQDDIWLDNKVKIMMGALEDCDLVLSDCIITNERGAILRESYLDNNISRTGFFKNYYKNVYLGCCMAFRRGILNYALPFPSKINSHDMWIGLVAELKGKVRIIPDKLIYFRRHKKNFSANFGFDTFLTGESPYKMHQIILSRIILFYYLMRMLMSSHELSRNKL